MKQKTVHNLEKIRYWWQEYWLLRWSVANIIGWAGALLLSAMMVRLFGFGGAFLAGAFFGFGLSLPQAWILFSADEMATRRKWIIYSAIGGFFGAFPAGILSIIGIFNIWIAALLMGAMFGGIWGLLQSFVLVPVLGDDAYLWIAVCLVAGALSALLTVPILLTPIPLLFSPATIVFSLISGHFILRWMNEN